ncbi:hypothetical protein, partial [Mesorhizobium sp.]|uniref:hypothetical protein n=1 Tax=Mesorhizobium sp. TaxID=1871066 RepID=UPI0025FC7B4B
FLRYQVEDRLIRRRKTVRKAQLTKHSIDHRESSLPDIRMESPIRFCAKPSQGEKVSPKATDERGSRERRRLAPLEHPVSALRADPHSPTRGKGEPSPLATLPFFG